MFLTDSFNVEVVNITYKKQKMSLTANKFRVNTKKSWTLRCSKKYEKVDIINILKRASLSQKQTN